jgi:Immunity protein 53
MIEWLEKWYADHCNDSWEHDYGIVIETIDNPGWSVSIDTTDTILDGLEIPYSIHERSENDWIGYSVLNNVFKGVGDAAKLNAIIKIFREIYEASLREN